MKKVLQILCLAMMCLCLAFISKARLDQALVIVPDSSDSQSAQTAQTSTSLIDLLIPETTVEPTPEPTATPEPEYFVLSCIGDMTLTTNQNFSTTSSAHYATKMNGDYSYPFANTVQYFEDDEITIGNLECSFSDRKLSNSIKALFYFLCPTEWINILPLGGVDFVTIANNHTMDFNDNGLTDTKAALESIDMPYGEDGQAQIITTKSGIKMGIYTSGNYDSVGTTVVPDKAAALAAIEQLKADGAEYIVMMFHWGSELKYRPTDLQVDLARACIDAGADLVYGSHSHCLQPIEEYNDGIILYSMGNWSFGGSTKPTDPYTAIVQLTLRRDGDGTIHNDGYDIIPCCVSSDLEGAAKDRDNYNDYKPTPLDPEDDKEAYDRVLSILDGSYEGADITRDYSDIYASYS